MVFESFPTCNLWYKYSFGTINNHERVSKKIFGKL